MARATVTALLFALLLPASVCWGMGVSPTLPAGTDLTGASTSAQSQQALAQQQLLQQQQMDQINQINQMNQLMAGMMQSYNSMNMSIISNLR